MPVKDILKVFHGVDFINGLIYHQRVLD